jgi:hypothetical protein
MASRTMIDAARFRGGEDRLTEILAVVLSNFEPAAIELLRHAGLDATKVEVSTQVRTDRGKRVDLQIVGLDSDGRLCARLWSEHKTQSEYMEDQLEGYSRDLNALGGAQRLITIAERRTPPRINPSWLWFTWDEVAGWFERLGREHTGDRRWRLGARVPDAEAAIRMLDELLVYLEEEHDVSLEPLTTFDVLAFSGANDAGERIVALVNRACEQSHLSPSRGVEWGKKDWGTLWQAFEDFGWAMRFGGYPELLIADTDFWLGDHVEAPAFGAGLTIQSRIRDALLGAEGGRWPGRAEELGFTIFEGDGVTRVYRTRYLTDLIAAGPSIDEQARELADWMTAAIDEIQGLDPELPQS